VIGEAMETKLSGRVALVTGAGRDLDARWHAMAGEARFGGALPRVG